MSDKKRKVPKLRFPGFTDDWEQRKLGEVTDKFDNLRIPIAAQLRVSGTTPYYGANGIQDYVDGFTHDGEFILLAEDGANNIYDYPVHYINGKVWVNNHAHVLQGREGTADNLFLLVSLKSINMEPYLVGGGRAKLNADVMMKLPIEVPSIQEQVLLGGFFDTLNSLISLHQRKLDNIKMLKKSLLQKLFPKDGEKIPELRFPGFTDAWEQRKLGEVGSLLKETVYPSKHPDKLYHEYSMPNYDDWKTPKVVKGNSMLSNRIKIKGNVLLINKLNVHQRRIWYVQTSFEDSVASGEFLPYISKEVNLEMLSQVLLSDSSTLDLISLSSGSSNSQKRITPEEFMKYNVMFPTDINEQNMIAKLLNSIDKHISLHQRKLDHLKELKKGLLQQMFV